MESPKKHKYSVQELIEGLTLKEEKSFLKAIKVRNNPSSIVLVNLFSLLKNYSSKEIIWKKLFPQKGYMSYQSGGDTKLRKLFHELKQELENFYINIALNKEPNYRSLLLLQEFSRRELNREFEKQYKLAKNELIKQPCKDQSYFRQHYELLVIYQQHITINKNLKSNWVFDELNRVQNLSFVLEKLEATLITLSNKGHLSKGDLPVGIINEIILHTEKNPEYWDSPIIALFKKFLQIFQQPTIAWEDLIYDYQKLFHTLEKDTAGNLYFILINSLIREHQSGQSKALQLLLSLYELGIEKKILFVDDHLPGKNYKNIISCCLQLQEFGKAKLYLNQLRPHLPEEVRDMYYRFCSALFFFSSSKYSNAISLVTKKFSDIHLEIQAKILLAQVWVEINEDVQLEGHLNSLRAFISYQDKLNTREKKNYLTRIKLLHKLISFDPDQSQKLQEIYTEAIEIGYSWLIEKISRREDFSTLIPR